MLLEAMSHAMQEYRFGRMAEGTRNGYKPSMMRIERLHAHSSVTKLRAARLPLSDGVVKKLRVMRFCALHKRGWFHHRI